MGRGGSWGCVVTSRKSVQVLSTPPQPQIAFSLPYSLHDIEITSAHPVSQECLALATASFLPFMYPGLQPPHQM